MTRCVNVWQIDKKLALVLEINVFILLWKFVSNLDRQTDRQRVVRDHRGRICASLYTTIKQKEHLFSRKKSIPLHWCQKVLFWLQCTFQIKKSLLVGQELGEKRIQFQSVYFWDLLDTRFRVCCLILDPVLV